LVKKIGELLVTPLLPRKQLARQIQTLKLVLIDLVEYLVELALQ
jgi:hypothetical protein